MLLNELIKNLPVSQDVYDATQQHFSNITRDRMISSASAKESLIKRLAKQGWSVAGTGYFSITFENPSKPYVLKINQISDKAYLQYVNLIKKFPNVHFPQISNVYTFKKYNKEFYMYIMEKLYPAIINNTLTSLLFKIAESPNDSISNVIDPILSTPVTPPYKLAYRYIKQHPDLVEAIRIIGRHHSDSIELDIEPKNFMQRKDGTLVIIDPYWDSLYEEI